MKYFLLLLIILVPLTLLVFPSQQPDIILLPSNNNKPNIYIFTSEHCPYCRNFRNEFLPQLKNKFSGKVNFLDLETSTPKGRSLYSKAAPQCLEKVGVPLIIAGNKCISGYPYSIKEKAIEAIYEVLKEKAVKNKSGK